MSKLQHVSRLLPKGLIHFVGIGGIGMSGIAEILNNVGYKVQGSDTANNYIIDRLQKLRIEVFPKHSQDNMKNVTLLVKSSAINDDNPEIKYCIKHNIPIITRAEMLAELMRLKISVAISGSHGKTTTTSLIASMFEASKLNPTVINGGIINSHGTNAYLGKGDFLIAEADESDGTFIKIPSTIAVITNIDREHLNYYKTFKNLKQAFFQFIENLPFYGFGVLCIDHAEVKKLADTIKNRKVITYGIKSKNPDVKATNIRQTIQGSIFDVVVSDKLNTKLRLIKSIHLNMPGIHNVQNALAAIAIALELGFNKSNIINGFKEFKGVKRRFTLVGEHKGIKIIDDYAHNPQKIQATLSAARQVVGKKGKILAIFQPHRYTRLQTSFRDFTKCFGDADIVYVSDVYSAGESPIKGIDSDSLIAAIKKAGLHKDIRRLTSITSLPQIVKENCKPNDLVIFLGAGTITQWAYDLHEVLV